jgi:hypothetical protein
MRKNEKEKTPMEQSDSTSEVTPYQLATLASRIDPELCASDPEKAIAAAERLLQEAEVAIDRAYQEGRRKEWETESAQMPRINWVKGLKQITGQERRDRAEERFLEFMEHELPGKSKQQLNYYRRHGFIEDDIDTLQHHFTNWQKEPKRKKGKQGRVRSVADGRTKPKLTPLPGAASLVRQLRKRLGRSDDESENESE